MGCVVVDVIDGAGPTGAVAVAAAALCTVAVFIPRADAASCCAEEEEDSVGVTEIPARTNEATEISVVPSTRVFSLGSDS